ncbi:hypothetical protein [Streptomyces natalensis]|uniref:Uncharacterized protein n=1 Tax=Streptomyces natalensis ATCC 27448 TaxID=1240678 RepID=A0A0D7CKN7_9ACTN|nr:hypothetical protein [Streptomyces natalensis]KIZ16656.1 hypothetical protein SNA_16640 [Streptomyces natalensis ATCC 27448]
MSVSKQPSPTFSAAASTAAATSRHIRSEATRLLCAGVYFDSDFRHRVIEQLVEHEERPIAPSLGIDALPVLAHALQARRREAETGLVLLAVWGLFIALGLAGVGAQTAYPIPWFLAYGVVCLVSWGVRGSRSSVFGLGRAVIKEATRGRLKAVLPVVPVAVGIVYWAAVILALVNGADAWTAAVFPVLLVPPVWSYRTHVVSVMREKLSRAAFAKATRETLPDTAQFRRIGAAIDREQHASLAIYDPFRPFVGAGEPYKPWSFVMELKRKGWQATPQKPTTQKADLHKQSTWAEKPGTGAGPAPAAAPGPLTGREVIDLITPQLESLRTSAAATSRDRLRTLEVDEMVYLPVGMARGLVKYEAATVQKHLNGAVGEGGEARRHFLRVRVGAWDEQVAISLLIRVHTQGGILVLEVVPHILTPVRPEFRSVDVIAARGGEGVLRDAVHSVLGSPSAGFAAGVGLLRTAVSLFRVWLTIPEFALPDGPATSVRELGSVKEVSLLQEMDISRYVKTLQDRIASGVREALRQKGYETGEFEQYVVNVNGGGVFIGQMSGGAVSSGEKSSAKHLDIVGDVMGGLL